MQLQLPPFAFGSAVALGIVCPRQQPNSAALLAQQCQPAGMDAMVYGTSIRYTAWYAGLSKTLELPAGVGMGCANAFLLVE